MTAISWKNAVSGNWSTASDWNPAQVPGSGDDVTIGATGTFYQIEIDSAQSVHSLALTSSSAVLAVNGTLTNGSTVTLGAGELVLGSGAIAGGTIAATGGTLVAEGGALVGVTYEGTLSANSLLTIVDGITLTGSGGSGSATINLTGAGSDLDVVGTTTLDNATVNIGAGATTEEIVSDDRTGTGAVLTLGSNLALVVQIGSYARIVDSGGTNDGIVNDGSLSAGVSGGFLDVLGNSFINQGSITASNGDTVRLASSNVVNNGSIAVNGGTLVIGVFDNPPTNFTNTGSVSVTDGVLEVDSTLTTKALNALTTTNITLSNWQLEIGYGALLRNSGTTLFVGTGSTYGTVLLDGTIRDGRIHDAGNGFAFNGGTLAGVTYMGTVDLSAANASLSIASGTTLTRMGGSGAGTVNLTGSDASLNAVGNVTLDDATIRIGNNTTASRLQDPNPAGHGGVLTLGSQLTMTQVGKFAAITDGGGLNNGIVNQGSINAAFSGGSLSVNGRSFTNQGSIAVSNHDSLIVLSGSFVNSGGIAVNSGTLEIANTFTNSGSIALTNSVLDMAGSLTTQSLIAANFTLSNSTVEISGLLNNTGTMLNVGTGTALGTMQLNGIIEGGTVAVAGNGFVMDGGNLDAATVAVAAGADLSGFGAIQGALADAGTIDASGSTLTLAGTLSGAGTLTASHGAVLALDGGGSFAGAITGAGTVEIAALTTLTPGASLSAANLVETAHMLLSGGVSLTNGKGDHFTIDAAVGKNTLLNGATGNTFTNDGSMVANGGGTAEVNVAFINADNVSVGSGAMAFLSYLTNDGTIDTGAGLVSSAGRVQGTGKMEIGAAGTLSLLQGALSGEKVDFLATTGSLDLTQPRFFTGVIEGFGGSDQIDLVNTPATGFSYSPSHVLTVQNGSQTVAALRFAGSYTQSDFALGSDGHGGTAITFA
jgi:fibronectin-binding autotransporter adhesin